MTEATVLEHHKAGGDAYVSSAGILREQVVCGRESLEKREVMDNEN